MLLETAWFRYVNASLSAVYARMAWDCCADGARGAIIVGLRSIRFRDPHGLFGVLPKRCAAWMLKVGPTACAALNEIGTEAGLA